MKKKTRTLKELQTSAPTEQFSTKEACLYLGVSAETLFGYYLHRGLPRRNLSPTKGARGPFYYRKSDLDDLLTNSFEVAKPQKPQSPKKNKPFIQYPDVILRDLKS